MFEIDVDKLNQLSKLDHSNRDDDHLLDKFGGIHGLLDQLRTSSTNGLNSSDSNDLESRRCRFGSNSIPTRSAKSFAHLMIQAAKDPTLIILIVGALISLLVSFWHSANGGEEEAEDHINIEMIEGIAILVTVLFIIIVVAYNDWSKEKLFCGLKSKIDSNQMVNVLRDAKLIELHIGQLLVGDICQIFYGHHVPADGVVILSLIHISQGIVR